MRTRVDGARSSRAMGAVLRAVAICVILAAATGVPGASGNQSQTDGARMLLIWPKVAGSATGAVLSVSIDGKSAVKISNLVRQELVSLGSLSTGPHQFSMTGIEVHSVDQAGITSRVNDGAGRCSGHFVVQPFQTYFVVLVGTGNGTDFQCRIQ